MNAQITIKGLDEAEKAAKEVLEHIEAIRQLQRGSAWNGISVQLELTEEKAASGN